MNLSKVKLVAADMDGTLLNKNHQPGPGFYPAFHKMVSKGILFAAASGRQFYNLLNLFEPIKEDMIFIAENGSYVVYKGEDILVQAMDADIARQQLMEARKIKDVFPILCGRKKAYIENDHPRFIDNVKMYYHRYEVVDDLLKVDDDQFLKIALCDLAGAETNSFPVFSKMQDQLQVKISGHIWLDISHLLANKGRAIEVLQRKFAIGFGETMVFGDYLNDLDMIQKAGFSYAMENAHPDIKKAARFLTKSNEEDGVTMVIEEMLAAIDRANGH
ncbi:MAG: HAD family hydrolase [Ferruginibacter sp.]